MNILLRRSNKSAISNQQLDERQLAIFLVQKGIGEEPLTKKFNLEDGDLTNTINPGSTTSPEGS